MRLGKWKVYFDWYPTYWMSHGHFFRKVHNVGDKGQTEALMFGCGACWFVIERFHAVRTIFCE